jgi:hypothetical protein
MMGKHRICTAVPVPLSAKAHLAVAREAALDQLKASGKYLLDKGASWRPRPSYDTDIRKTFEEARQ